MGKLVEPEVYQIGTTCIVWEELLRYLRDSGNEEFVGFISRAREEGLSEGETMISFYAKLCYATLTDGKNENVKKVREIADNIKACHDQGHASVFRHVKLNFVIRNASRVLECELLRHAVGTDFSIGEEGGGIDFSITSGRYVRGDEFRLVFDPILEPVREKIQDLHKAIEDRYREMVATMNLDSSTDMAYKKKVTSALRRIMPEGKAKEIGFSINLQALRHVVQMRTSRHAEWEIRLVFSKVYNLVKDKYPLLFYGAVEEVVDGILEVKGMRMQPYG